MLSLQAQKDDDTHVIRLGGELDMANAELLETELNDALADGSCRIVVDMRELEFIDSTGIAILVAALGDADGDGRRLCFVPSQAQAVSRVLHLTGVDKRMPLVPGTSLNGETDISGAS